MTLPWFLNPWEMDFLPEGKQRFSYLCCEKISTARDSLLFICIQNNQAMFIASVIVLFLNPQEVKCFLADSCLSLITSWQKSSKLM